MARSPLPPLFPRLLSATSVKIVSTHAARRGAMTIYLSRPKMLKLCTRPTLQCDGGGRRTWSFEALSNLWGPMDSLPPPHDMCIKSNQEDKSPPSRPSDNGSAPACFQSLLEVQFSYYAHYQMTTTSSLSTISPSPSISFVFQDAHKQMRIIRFLHNL